jgi:phenylalanyl-tRNA synthetase beta chain
VPVAVPGARVKTLAEPVSVRPMVGGAYESQGMLCSAHELGISEDHSGILVLPTETPVGADVADLLGLDDYVLEFEIYPNRPDQMSVIGIAREVSVVFDTPLRMPSGDVVEEGGPASGVTSVTVEDATGCPRYLARVIEDVKFGASPPLVQARLTACGFRPLGNLVDATNYVLLMTGQPLHAFDLDKLAEQRIVVRRARAGEKLTSIDGEVRELEESDLVIADAKDAVAIAGVMGGADTEVGPSTKRVLLESAHFDSISIARTSRKYHMHTEAAARFERGSDPEAVPLAAALAAEAMRVWAGGVVTAGAVDVGEAPPRRTLSLRPSRVPVILGADVSAADRDRYFRGLGCDVSADGAAVSVVVPSWRPDLEREIDLIEELARLHGYEKFEGENKTGVRGGRSVPQRLRVRVRDVLVGAGLSEAFLPSWVPPEDLDAIGYDGSLVCVTNPMTEDQRRLRPNLFAGLLRAAQRNNARGVADVRLFEFGKVFRGWKDDEDLPREEEHVGFVLTGNAGGRHWSSRGRGLDVFDAKGLLESLFDELGVSWDVEPATAMPFHPGRAANVLVDGGVVGRFGEVRPSVARSFDLEGAVVIGGVALTPVLSRARMELHAQELPTQPPVLRDISMFLPRDVAARDVEATIREAGGGMLESVELLDVFEGERAGPGRRSLAYRLTFRASDRTLRAEEADAAREAIAAACRDRLGAEIR